MSEHRKTFRSPLAVVRGLGSAKSGFEPWLLERVSALLMIPAAIYVTFGFLGAYEGGYSGTMYWLQSPVAATCALLLLLAGLRHMVCGLQVVMEDYIHLNTARLPLLFVVKFGAAFLALIGSLSIAKIYFGV